MNANIDVYKECPSFCNNVFLLRPVLLTDVEDLLLVYSDVHALPFFNSDNCDGDNFYYETHERMEQAIHFWQEAYHNDWFVRWSIVDNITHHVIGTVEMFRRVSEDSFNGAGVIRLDLRSDYEKESAITSIWNEVIDPFYDLFGCNEIITKIPNYAIERAKAAQSVGFTPTQELMIGTQDGYAYRDYWKRERTMR